MKKLVVTFALLLTVSFAFATNKTEEISKESKEKTVTLISKTKLDKKIKTVEYVDHTCTYAVFNSRNERIGTVVMSGVPDNVACGSSGAKKQALRIWNEQ